VETGRRARSGHPPHRPGPAEIPSESGADAPTPSGPIPRFHGTKGYDAEGRNATVVLTQGGDTADRITHMSSMAWCDSKEGTHPAPACRRGPRPNLDHGRHLRPTSRPQRGGEGIDPASDTRSGGLLGKSPTFLALFGLKRGTRARGPGVLAVYGTVSQSRKGCGSRRLQNTGPLCRPVGISSSPSYRV